MTEQNMENIFEVWFQRVKNLSNSMLTTEELTFTQGWAQLKWWKQCSQLIVKVVEINELHRGQKLFTTECQKFLARHQDVNAIMMESVLEKQLFNKLLSCGWTPDSYSENNLLMKRAV